MKGLTVSGAGNVLGGFGLVITGADMLKNGANWNNGTDAVMGAVAFVPGVGWIISGVYFISNAVIQGTTGKSIGDHLSEFSENLNFTRNMDLSNMQLFGHN